MKHRKMNINKVLDLMLEIKRLDSTSNEYDNRSIYGKRIPVTNIPNSDDICKVELKLKIKLPESYITYNKLLPWYSMRSTCNLIINPINTKAPIIPFDIVTMNQMVREKSFYKIIDDSYDDDRYQDWHYELNRIPDHFIICDSCNSIDDNYMCFDLRFPDKMGEYPLISWSPFEYDYRDFEG
jgi:hypothetical protein